MEEKLNMYIVTTENIADKTISEVKGAIFSEQVISVNIVKDTLSGLKGIFGGKSTTYSDEYAKGRNLAIKDLKAKAHSLSANAITKVQVSYTQFVNSDIMLIAITASGTAVVIEE
ncbi:hypothetical protein FD15_GL000908 [Liquorilactobacillus sucicola DSM 21376 = JCM 15457]|uniref:Uncharacterized protein n=2 Tax=Liquorilactobacillus sucicola TaxID=519050 RepID=A0A0R2DUK4_9LACO|nr:hypothetical protein FD15_GL000908 [Liquorilactobacillus sucicola DSM 21376 = JCM 15457]